MSVFSHKLLQALKPKALINSSGLLSSGVGEGGKYVSAGSMKDLMKGSFSEVRIELGVSTRLPKNSVRRSTTEVSGRGIAVSMV